ncbi:MAG: hypothetical protein WCH93_10700 [Actinomycetota bacterium]
MKNCAEQSPGVSKQASALLQNAREFWKWYEEVKGTSRETHLGADLSGLYAEYQDVVGRTPIDIGRVESLTAEAALLLLGRRAY